MIFETERLLVRQLIESDLEGFHEMQSDPEVMKYVDGEPKSLSEHQKELQELIGLYAKRNNEFIIYAIERKLDYQFVGTVALVKDDHSNDEIGYRFSKKYWGQGFGFEIVQGLVRYCISISKEKLIAYVSPENKSSERILQKVGFVQKGIEEKSGDFIYEWRMDG